MYHSFKAIFVIKSDHSVTGLLPISFSAQAEAKQFEIPIKLLLLKKSKTWEIVLNRI